MIFSISSLRTKLSFALVSLCLGAAMTLSVEREASAVGLNPVLFEQESESLSVMSSLDIDEQLRNDLMNGVKKELTFYIDLFRQWELWPDEFIHGIKFSRTISSDPIKKEYIVIFDDGLSRAERRFNSLDTLLEQGLRIDVKHALSTAGLPDGNYFVRLTVESRIRKLAPIIGYFLFFVPEKEFTIKRDSALFKVHQQ